MSDCNKPVLSKDSGLHFEVCDLLFHCKCENVYQEAYRILCDLTACCLVEGTGLNIPESSEEDFSHAHVF